MMNPMDTLKLFALVREEDGPNTIVGYGMVLPDGSAYSVSWPPSRGTSIWSAASAEQTADLRDADLHWLCTHPEPRTL